MTEAEKRKVETELDYVSVEDPNAYFIQVVNAVSGVPFEHVLEANAVDGWLYQIRTGEDGATIKERFINDRGVVDIRAVRFRVEAPIAIVFTDAAPANLRSQEFRLKAK